MKLGLDLVGIVENIYRYPIKGFSGEMLDNVTLETDNVIPGDREYAFAKTGVAFDPDNPHYIRKTNFLALVKYEKLASLETKFSDFSKEFSLSTSGVKLIEGSLSNKADCQNISNFLKHYLNMPTSERPHLVTAAEGTQAHSFSDVPDKAISLINLSSVDELSTKTKTKIDHGRFRGNIYFKGNKPWQEFNWIDSRLRIGEVIFHVFKRIKRCAATNVNPFSAIRDINIPTEIKKHYQHTDLGIYGIVKKGGVISVGDKIELLCDKSY